MCRFGNFDLFHYKHHSSVNLEMGTFEDGQFSLNQMRLCGFNLMLIDDVNKIQEEKKNSSEFLSKI